MAETPTDRVLMSRRQALRAGVHVAAWTVPAVGAVAVTASSAQAASPLPNPGGHEPVKPSH
ncbi:MAG: hypothetical protein ACFCVF_13925, partial [Kineosporiaceae bacterium]